MPEIRPESVPRVGRDEKLFEPVKVLFPEKVFALARRVEEAAVIVMSAVPLKETLLMFLAV